MSEAPIPSHPTVAVATAHLRVVERPVFIVGSPRSGTSNFADALGQHSALWTSRETFLLEDLLADGCLRGVFDSWSKRPSPTWFQEESVDFAEFISYVGAGFNALFTQRSGGRRWIDHTPHYVKIIGQLIEMFPGAQFIHLLRDGRAAVHSMLHVVNAFDPEEARRMESTKFVPAWAKDLGAACREWTGAVEAGLEATANRSDQCRTVRFEELVADTRSTMTRVFEFLDVEPEEAPIAYFSERNPFSSFSSEHGPPADRATRAWDSWTDEERDLFQSIAGGALVRAGYTS